MKHSNALFGTLVTVTGLLFAGSVCAFDFGNMMNPSKWMNDNDNDYYDDDYYYGGPGAYGPHPGYYGAPGYAPGYGYGVPPYGAGVPAYGAPAYGGGYAAPAAAAPATGYGPDHDLPDTHSGYERNRDKEEIERLKERIRKLEATSQQAPAPVYGGQPAYQHTPTQPGYGSQQPSYGAQQPAYGSQSATPQPVKPGWNSQGPWQYRQE